ncbi:type II toxin-antitoxin system MqsA family antitoxin [candidate division KSB1 bacterium]|nr:type II toxin-antitoxin system MqsA family antitoxin [candidate division KSB1 bacterium]
MDYSHRAKKKENKHDKCYFCKSDGLIEKNVDYSFWWGEKLILFKEVPALVCESCGEKYFRPEISTNMKRIAKEIKDGKRGFKELTIPAVKFEQEGVA